MKICFSVTTFPARSQTFVTTQLVHAVRAGHEVTVACRERDRDVPLTEEIRSLLESVRIVTWPPRPPAFLRALPYPTADRIAARLARNSWRRQVDADVIVAHFGYRGADVARAQKGWAAAPPLVTIFHGRDVSMEHERSGLAKYRELFAWGDLNLAVNEPFAELLVQGGAPASQVETHHLGVPVASYEFTSRPPGVPLRILSVCRLVEKKGLDIAIEALAELRDRQPQLEWRYEIAGDGPMDSSLKAQVARHGLAGRITFLGPLSHEQALRRIASADIFMLPSVTAPDGDQEGIPVTLMEAMALGTPVCSTRHSGIPELVTHGETGMLSEERDLHSLCDNIARLANGEIDTLGLAAAARRKVERDFDEAQQNTALLGRCERLVAARHS